MSIKLDKLNGQQLYYAIAAGIDNLVAHQKTLDEINVFPVPDGDTGTNLLFTLRPIIKIEEKHIDSHFGKTLSIIANTAIDSARGNSGTIMAQYFIGMLESAEKLDNLNLNNERNLLRVKERLISAWDYKLLSNPSLDEILLDLQSGDLNLDEALQNL